MQASRTSSERLEALRKKEAALKEAIAEEKVRQQKRDEKEQARLASIIGECVLADIETNPQLGLLVEASLKRNSNPRAAEFLKSRGWRI